MQNSCEVVIAQIRNTSEHLAEGVSKEIYLMGGYFSEVSAIGHGWPVDYQGEEPIQALGSLRTLQLTDMPVANFTHTLISKRMLEVLLLVGEFKHRAIPVQIYNYSVNYLVDEEKAIRALSKAKQGKFNDDFILLQLFEPLDIIDLARSEYHQKVDYDPANPPDYLTGVDKFFFHDTGIALPPIFRLQRCSVRLYVSLEAKAALEAAGIRGVEFVLTGGQYC